jgi:3-isopropylmalate/(R)-2-methylmalate dehydratase small subunit
MALEKITRVTGKGVYIPGQDIDTDRIIPARYLKCVTFDDLAEGLFYDVRYTEDGGETAHPLNDLRFKGATILLAGANFGCGSSREHAPQAIYRYGFRALIAESFAEIFYGNSVTLGMPCVEATKEQIEDIATRIEADPRAEISLDILNSTVSCGEKTVAVHIRESARDALINGRWDPIADLLEATGLVDETARGLAYLFGPPYEAAPVAKRRGA